ncbi:MAG: Nickel/cobalt homeostasis protein RcnB [Paracidovorax wautersii]|uniref:Nickel/cobalt homeostasis protein RcnB n=1 Tax=Paracidovorax wautersii TaxID=1177982 RepID=A0A7V8FQ96_9BURK|nr:MAG: Nickel/cobalt homeostasis protein RcnB [Paracidovorax wautersii]
MPCTHHPPTSLLHWGLGAAILAASCSVLAQGASPPVRHAPTVMPAQPMTPHAQPGTPRVTPQPQHKIPSQDAHTYQPPPVARDGQVPRPQPGWQAPALRVGQPLPPAFRDRVYRVEDWRAYQLPPPPRGQHWVQVGGQSLLVSDRHHTIVSQHP